MDFKTHGAAVMMLQSAALEKVLRELRLAFDAACFQATCLHADLHAWQTQRQDTRNLLR